MGRIELLSATTAIAVLCLPGIAGDAVDLAALISDAELKRDARIVEVRSLRQYTIRNPRWKSDATMEALMITTGNRAKRYEILDMNADGLRKKILLRILDGEVEAASRGDRDGNINSVNYELRPIQSENAVEQTCRPVQLIPKRRTRFIFEGRGCVDLNDMAMVRMEGRTAKRISFLVGKAYVMHEFRKVGEFWYSSSSRSTANVKFLGTTELLIEYVDYTITPKDSAARTR